VTTAGGTEPRWRKDGTELYFRRGAEVHAVRLSPGPPLPGSASTQETLAVRSVDRLFDAGAPIRAFDVSPDGTRFLLNLPASGSAPRTATMVINWQSHASRGNTEPQKH
jgi:hypothetical protein